MKNKIVEAMLAIKDQLPFILISVLRPVGPACLNRNEDGSQKTINLGGGVPRTRYSSQSYTHRMRLETEDENNTRTRELPMIIKSKLFSLPEKEVEGMGGKDRIDTLVDGLFKDTQKEKNGNTITKTVMAVGKADIDAYVENTHKIAKDSLEEYEKTIKNNEKNNKEDPDPAIKKIKDAMKASAPTRKLDEATVLYGRMSSDPSISTVYSATMRGHAVSINANMGDSDEFVACDDYKDTNDYLDKLGILGLENDTLESNGAAHMNTRPISSDVFYCPFIIDMKTLFTNFYRGLEVTPENTQKVLKQTRIEAAKTLLNYIWYGVPDTNKSSMLAQSDIRAAYIVVTQRQPIPAYRAFGNSIHGDDVNSAQDIGVEWLIDFAKDQYGEGSLAVENKYLEDLGKYKEIDNPRQYWIAGDEYDDDLPDFIKRVKLNDLLPAIMKGEM